MTHWPCCNIQAKWTLPESILIIPCTKGYYMLNAIKSQVTFLAKLSFWWNIIEFNMFPIIIFKMSRNKHVFTALVLIFFNKRQPFVKHQRSASTLTFTGSQRNHSPSSAGGSWVRGVTLRILIHVDFWALVSMAILGCAVIFGICRNCSVIFLWKNYIYVYTTNRKMST